MNNIMVPEDLKKNTMRVSELVPYVGNAKKHPEWQVEQIANSIQAFGFNDPIAIWQDIAGHWVIVEGHGRLLAAKELGMDEVPVIKVNHLDDEGRRAYTLAHNKLTMNTEFDPQILHAELGAIEGLDMEEFGFDAVTFADGAGTFEPDPELLAQYGESGLKAYNVILCCLNEDEQQFVAEAIGVEGQPKRLYMVSELMNA